MSTTDPTAIASSSSSSSASASAPSQNSVRVFLPPTSSSSFSSSPSTSLLPPGSDDELKPTAEELKIAFRSTLLGRNGPDAPLLTRALREREEARLGLNSSKTRHWNAVKIRLRFSDRTQVESTFAESDTIDKLYAFLDSILSDEVRAKDKVLYTAPPKIEYRLADKKTQAKTLRQLGLIPSAVVNVKWIDERMNANTFAAPIKPELKQIAEQLPPPPSLAVDPQDDTQHNAKQGKEDANQPKPLPKWLKNIVKK